MKITYLKKNKAAVAEIKISEKKKKYFGNITFGNDNLLKIIMMTNEEEGIKRCYGQLTSRYY